MALHLLQYSDVENAFDEPERVARLAGAIDARRSRLEAAGEPVLVVGTGDVFGPGVLALETTGRHALRFFDAVSPVAETLGNHDFDHGAAVTRDLVADAPHEFLVANAFETPEGDGEDAGRFAAANTAASTIVTVDGVDVGFVGAASPETATMAPGASTVEFRDPLPYVREELADLRGAGVDHTVVLAHLGEADGEALAAAVDADLVLDGHRHQPFATTFDGTGYARPGNGARRFVHATLHPDAPATDGDAPTAATTPGLELVETADASPHEALLAGLRERFDATGLSEVVATVADPIDCSKSAVDRGESRVGNLVTDAYRWRADADVAVMAPGGIRTRDPLAGAVTRADLVGLVPFDNDLLTCEVDGETLRAVLASTTLHHYLDDVGRKFGHYAGVEVVWDDVDGRARSVTVDGDPLDPAATYRLAATDYFVETDHIYPSIQPEHVVDRHGRQYDALVAYVEGLADADPTPLDPTVDGRIERPTLDQVAADGGLTATEW